jgi:endonuclease/exonuclease/phosphatase (EEP) superfamily protein YafD
VEHPAAKREQSWLQVFGNWLLRYFFAAGVFLSAATLIGFLGRFYWVFDLASHFRVQYAIALLAIAILFLFARDWKSVATFLVFGTINAAMVVPMYFGAESFSHQRTLRAMLFNVHTQNGSPAEVVKLVLTEQPDFLILEEINASWLNDLAELKATYPHKVVQPRADHFGIGLWSKFPLLDVQIVEIGESAVPTIFAVAQSPQGEIQLVGTHPLPPGGAEYSRLRNEQLRLLAETVAAFDRPILLLGDLNTTPWNHHFQNFLSQSGLQNSAAGRGVQASWPSHLLPLRIPLDHCLHSPSIGIANRRVGANSAGSDHFPVIVDFGLKADHDR